MPTYPLRALVLRKTKLGESDTILTLLAADGRQVRAVAKGLRKSGSRFGARLEPYSEVDLLLYTGRSLDVISDARTVESGAALREDFDRCAAAAVVADVLDKVAVEGQAEERLFGLATASLCVMATAPVYRLTALVDAFLIKAMAMHGYRPSLQTCAACGADAGESTTFSLPAGGVVCDDCAAGPGCVTFSASGRAWLSALLAATMTEVATMDIPAAAVADCFTLLRSFVAYHLPARLKALDFYATTLS